MDPKRQGEIAIQLVRCILREKGFRIARGYKRELGNLSKRTGVSVEELAEFLKPLVHELVDDSFAPKKK